MFDSHQKGAVALTFTNGTRVSIIWKPGSHSDNHDAIFDDPARGGRFNEARLMGTDPEPCISTTAEVMVTDDPTKKAVPFVRNQYGDNPAGHLSVDNVLDLLVAVRRLK